MPLSNSVTSDKSVGWWRGIAETVHIKARQDTRKMTSYYCCVSYNSFAFASQFRETAAFASKGSHDPIEVYIEKKICPQNKVLKRTKK